ncbi:MAG TPA: hypothetical protein VJL29_04085 [Thermoguttaceae bacterium]|nr:hypothetical protein [Thermoguttaceae bacterium]
MLKTRTAGIAVALCLLVAGGCLVSSKHPLSDEKTSKADTRLLGDWKEKSDDAKGVWQVVKRPQSENVLVTLGPYEEQYDPADLLLTTELGGKKYLSWGGREPKNGKTNFIICRYEMPDENTLSIRYLSIDAVRDAIEDQRLSGRVTVVTDIKTGKKPISERETVRITAEMDELRSFLEANGDDCFPEGEKADMVFVRVAK